MGRPPGRAGRVWLAARIDVGRRASELLEQKQQLLRREQRRLAELAGRTEREWHSLATEADTWNARASVAGGRDEVRRGAALVRPAQARLTWTSQAGVTYPATASVDLPPAPPPLGAAVTPAATACARALEAAVRHAAAESALARVEAELSATVRRLRAIRDRWLPRLEADLHLLELRVDDAEREETTRLRWAGPDAGKR